MPFRRTRRALACALPLALAAAPVLLPTASSAVAAPKTSAAAVAAAVSIDNFTFGPQALTVPVGATVTWTNHDDIPHAVVSDDRKTFKSKVLDTDQSFSFTFTRPGEFGYFCSLHPHMTGKVIVKG
jgi:plastocyanin